MIHFIRSWEPSLKRSPYPSLILIIFLLAAITASQEISQNNPCFSFTTIKPWTVINHPACTLSVQSCKPVKSVTFRVYYEADSASHTPITTLGEITRPPYKLIWDITDIPVQLTFGMSCFAMIELADNTIETIEQQGVFLVHKPVKNPVHHVAYSLNPESKQAGNKIVLNSADVSAAAEAQIMWNEKFLWFHIEVDNPQFYTTIGPQIMSTLGIKIFLDPQYKRTPYINDSVHVYVVSMNAEQTKVGIKSFYKPDGTFHIEQSKQPVKYLCSIKPENFKGFTIDFAIPWDKLGPQRPETLGCNLIATVLDQKSQIRSISWIQGSSNYIQSPLAYAALEIQGKPLLANSFLLWVVYYWGGFFTGCVTIFCIYLLSKRNPVKKFEESEQEKQLLRNINTIIEAEIVNKDFSIANIASPLGVSPQNINRVIKKSYHTSFKKHILNLRIEIVKERLRSSNSSEISIAKSCGFSSASEMEKKFTALCKISPYKYREKNRII